MKLVRLALREPGLLKRYFRGKGRKIGALKAWASDGKRAHDLIADVGTLYRPIKKPVTLRIDADVLAWFKKQGPGYQTRINQALRRVMLESKN
ncbi:MAG: BrnA antitoxin family protein [Candidatus Acidiferrum sp.]